MKRLFFLVLLFVPLVFITCFDNGDGSVKTTDEIIVKPKTFESYLHFEFMDAKTGVPLRGKEVSLTVKGKDAALVYNNLGQKESVYTTKAGFYDFMIDVAKATGDFVISTSCDGYENNIQRVRLQQGAKFTTVQAKLLKLNNLPDGISVAPPVTFTTNGQGQTDKEVIINANTLNAVRIPQGVTLKDAGGKTVTGKVDAKVMFFTPNESVEYFPGGLDVETVDANGQSQNSAFISAGAFDIQLTSGNTPVKTIDGKGFELTTVLDPELINPETGNPVVEGDKIPLWSMDSETAVWKLEKTAVIKKNANGQLYLSEEINHLSTWNWDWSINSCYLGATIKWEGNFSDGVNVKVTNSSSMNYHKEMVVRADKNDPLQVMFVPSNIPMTVAFEGVCGSDLTFVPQTLEIPNMCEGTFPVQIIQKASSTQTIYTVNVDINVSAKSNPNLRLSAYAWVYFYKTCDYAYQSFYVNDGKFSASVEPGTDYIFNISLGQAWGYGYLRVDDIGGNKLRIRFSPEYSYYFDANWNYWNLDIPKQEITIDKPANNVITISNHFTIEDSVLTALM